MSGPALLLAYSAGALIAGAVPVAVAWLTKLVLDELMNERHPTGWLIVQGVLLACVGMVAAVVPQLSRLVYAQLSRAIRLRALEQLYSALSRFSGLARFDDPRVFDRLRLAQQAAEVAPRMILDALLGALRSLVTMTGFLVSLLAVNPIMAGVVLVAGTPAVFAELALSRSRSEMLWRTAPNARRQSFYAQMMTDRAAAKEIRLFGLGDFLRQRMFTELRKIMGEESLLDRRVFRTQFMLVGLSALVSGGGLIWSIVLARAGELSPGDVVIFVAAVSGVQAGLSGLTVQIASAHQGLAQFGHYVDVLNADPDLAVPERPIPARQLREAIEFKDVWFRYDEHQPWTLRGLNLRIECGRSLAMVGINGAGKSTVVKLLCRLYDPTHGSITWDGVDIRSIPVADLRDRISTVFQDHMNYDFTAAENIGLGDLDVMGDRDRIRVAAEAAQADQTIEALPNGYDTLLSRIFYVSADSDGKRAGVTLSGGQWQRMALARGLMRGGRDLLILDEPSSGLDAEAEHMIHRRLADHRKGTTNVMISHRLSTVRLADHIVVLDGGQISEQGTHEQLVAGNGSYARMFRLQASGYAMDQQLRTAL